MMRQAPERMNGELSPIERLWAGQVESAVQAQREKAREALLLEGKKIGADKGGE